MSLITASDVLSANILTARATFETLSALAEPLGRAANLVAGALLSGHQLIVCGNGGSAADAMHFATEYVGRFNGDRRPFPAICLNANGCDLTAIGNDYAFDDCFSRQVRAFAGLGDVLVVFTSTGNSRNILNAIEAARAVGAASVAFLGRDGGFTAGRADVDLTVAGHMTARIQEAHKLLLHTLCELVEPELKRV
jgi:phosphoheptose isomerase